MSGGLTLATFAPDKPDGRAVWLVASPDDARAVWALLREPKPTLLSVQAPDWNRDLSPWPAARAFKGGEDFAGGADAFLRRVTADALPCAEAALPCPVARRCLAGVSLAGLFALYALYRADWFDAAAAVSGSLWYDGFTDFLRRERPAPSARLAYLSVGDRERATQNARLATVEDRAREAREILEGKGLRAAFELNPGNHFADGAARTAKAVDWVCGEWAKLCP